VARHAAPRSVLRPETLAVLREVRPRQPLFSNQILAELFEANHTIGPLRVYPRTVGGYIVVDMRRPVGRRTLETIEGSEDDAHAALERWAAKERVP
jgi:hypothetical protein